MRRWIVPIMSALLMLALSSVPAPAQETGSQPSQPDQSQPPKEKKEKKDKKKDKKDKGGQQDVLNTEAFSDAVANDVLGLIRDGLEGHSYRLMLSAFDSDKMDGYLTFEDAIQAMFDKYDGFRVHYRILQTSTEGSKAVVLTTFEMEELPRSGGAPQRRGSEVRFELERGKKGWRVVDFTPRGFFS